MTDSIPTSYSKAEVCAALHLSPRNVDQMIRDGKVSFYQAGRSKRFLGEHVAQIIAALEVKVQPVADTTPYLGLSRQSAARRRRTA